MFAAYVIYYKSCVLLEVQLWCVWSARMAYVVRSTSGVLGVFEASW